MIVGTRVRVSSFYGARDMWEGLVVDSTPSVDLDGTPSWVFLVLADSNGRYFTVPAIRCRALPDRNPEGGPYR